MAVPSTRVILSVPFEEKDQAKSLGARWDPVQRHWWITSDVDTAIFVRWLQSPILQEPLYREVSVIDLEEFATYERVGTVEVFFVPWTCWKCNRETLAFHAAINQAIHVTHLLYQPPVIEELDRIRREFKLERFGCIKARFSRTLGQSYVSQGCRYCDALIGEHPLWEDFSEIGSTMDLSTYPLRRSLSWSLLRKASTGSTSPYVP